MSSVNHCKIITLPKIDGTNGSITPITGGKDIPFEIARIYYLYDVPGGEARGGHAHKELQQLLISASGSFDVILNDGRKKRKICLNRSYYGLYIPKLIWRELDNFSTGAICLVLASLPYDKNDYIRNYEEFKKYMAKHQSKNK
ncbi:WxcM-like domain-containing protein [bacterium]|nr:WxcM-like domain-containing protein [bacterium]